MAKVSLTDKRIFKNFWRYRPVSFAVLSGTLIFVDIPDEYRIVAGVAILVLLILTYLVLWGRSNNLQDISLSIEGSTVNIKTGDIFQQLGLKAIAFNEYFDTVVDDRIIAKRSLNGIFLEQHLETSVADLDRHIDEYQFEDDDVLGREVDRAAGKRVKYKVGTICVYKDYLLTAFARFDDSNRANLTMPEYLEFLINFLGQSKQGLRTTKRIHYDLRVWYYANQGHKNISDEDLLKIMLWTFRISEMRFKHPAKLTIVIHKEKIDQINLLDIKSARNGM